MVTLPSDGFQPASQRLHQYWHGYRRQDRYVESNTTSPNVVDPQPTGIATALTPSDASLELYEAAATKSQHLSEIQEWVDRTDQGINPVSQSLNYQPTSVEEYPHNLDDSNLDLDPLTSHANMGFSGVDSLSFGSISMASSICDSRRRPRYHGHG